MKKRGFLSVFLTLALAAGLSVPAAAGGMGKVGAGTTVSTGGYHTAVLQEDGSLWIWGNNGSGQIGNGGTGNDALEGFSEKPLQTIPIKVMEDVASVSCGIQNSLLTCVSSPSRTRSSRIPSCVARGRKA